MPELSDLTEELSKKKKIKKKCLDLYKEIQKGFQDQADRANETMDFWDCYNGILNYNQGYQGNAQVYVPVVHNAIEARTTRFCNQVFPSNGRYVEVVTENGDIPYAHQALIESYIRKTKLRTEVMPALCRNGDVEGQYSIYVTWKKTERKIRYREMQGVALDGIEGTKIDGMDDIENVIEEDFEEGCPDVKLIADADLCVLPATTDNIDDAIQKGGSVTIAFRLSKGEVKEYIDDGTFDKEVGKQFLKGFTSVSPGQRLKDTSKENASAAGIKTHSGGKFALVYQTWSMIKIGKKKRLCVTWFGGSQIILSCKRNPYWCDRVPVISCPVKKVGGVFKGMSQVSPCAFMQYAANDAINEGLDSATYSLLPIVMTDPEKNPRIGSMVMNLMAIWQTNPNDTKIVEMPQLWRDAFEIVASCQSMVYQTMSVNPAMITQSTKKKQSQAEVANEQAVDVLTTADAVTILEEGILTPLVERFYDYDRQFRTKEITVKAYGQMGVRAMMEEIPPIQENNRYSFRWFGVEQVRSVQKMQQQISFANVLKGIPPELYQGRKLDLVPLLESMCENVYGPRLAPLTFVDQRDQLSVDPEIENDLLNNGYDVHTHELDDDVKHLQSHAADLQSHGDKSGFIRVHILAHQKQLQMKRAQASMQSSPAPGGGAGGGQGSGPRPGSVPQPGSGMRQPNGAVHPDQMNDAAAMPRKM